MAEVTIPERWLPVVGWPGYEVSDLGRVRSVDRIVTGCDGKVQHLRGRVLRQVGPGANGYFTVGLSRGGIEKTRLVHQLVAAAFIGPCPPGQEVRHGPNGKLDNRASELCYGTRKENFQDRVRDGVINRGERNGHAKLTWEAVDDIRRRVAAGETQRTVAAHYGVHFATVSAVIVGKNWRHRP